jgi:hypothetical protein
MQLMFWIDQDFDQIYSVSTPMATLEDFPRGKWVAWHGTIEKAVLKTLGASYEPMSVTEISENLRAGKVDAAMAPSIWVVGAQLYTVFKYVNPVKIRYSPAVIVVTMDTYNAIKATGKNVESRFLALRGPAQDKFCKATREDGKKSIEAMLNYGVKEVKMTPDAYAALRKKALSVYRELAGDVYPVNLLQELQRYLAEKRGQSGAEEEVTAAPAPAASTALSGEEKTALEKKKTGWEKRAQQVRKAQERLKALGYYPSSVDGIAGPITYKAVRQFQKSKNLPETGAIDDALLDSLGAK